MRKPKEISVLVTNLLTYMEELGLSGEEKIVVLKTAAALLENIQTQEATRQMLAATFLNWTKK